MTPPNDAPRFRDVPGKPEFPAQEAAVQAFWDQRDIYRRSLEQRQGAERYVFYEGPPTANGMPHPGHCLTRAMKDLFPRYQTMRGKLCERKAGWDTHGLPVEIEVQKELGITTKEQIEEYGIEPFIRRCQESVFKYTKEWEALTRSLGFWVDLESPYATYHQYYVESVWWALKRLFEGGLLYQGDKIVWWWAQGGTGLSAGEVGEGYRTVDDPSVYVRMPLLDEDGTSLLVWTTTPWTLPSNHFCAVHPELDYVVARDEETGERLIVAADLLEQVAEKGKRSLVVVERRRGCNLVGVRYEPPFDIYTRTLGETKAPLSSGGADFVGWRVVAADFVTTDSGTGVVHQAPAFGEVDHDVLMAERKRFAEPSDVPLLNAVAPDGTFTADLPEFQGQWVKDADKELIRNLRDSGRLYHREQYRHDYPFCPRSDQDALIQYPRRSWFIRTTNFVREMSANNAEITWLPEHIRDGRFGKYLETNVDWTLSRERFWGTPLPVWVCETTGQMEAVESYDELLSKPGVEGTEVWAEARVADPDLDENLKIHRPWIDAIHYDSPFARGARMHRVRDVIDCWFDAGSMPFAQWGFPHKNREKFVEQFPAQFISEAIDQTRGWFYALLSISTLLFGEAGVARGDPRVPADLPSRWPHPFESCIVLGHVLGEDGLKMSKRLKNYRTPEYIFENEGSDAMRWLFFSQQPPWTSVRFQEQAIADGQREFLIRLWNVYSFFTIYANIDGWRPRGDLAGTPGDDLALTELDRWILSELHRTVAEVRARLDRLENFPAASGLNDFVDALSNWYVRRSRDRFWAEGLTPDKNAAYATLYHCLVTVTGLAAPFVPFITETLYQNLVGSRGADDEEFPESVHLTEYPEPETRFVDLALSDRMAMVREVTSLGRAARAQAKIKVRQPLDRVELILARSDAPAAIAECTSLIEEELNVKSVHFLEHADEYVRYEVKANFRTIGPKFGKDAPVIQKELRAYASPAALLRSLEEDGEAPIVLPDGREVVLTAEDVQVEVHAREGWTAAQGRVGVIVLHTEITEDLRKEGIANELVHHVQQLRKDLDLRYEQRIDLYVTGDEGVLTAAAAHEERICRETLALTLALESGDGDGHTVAIEGMSATIWVKPQ